MLGTPPATRPTDQRAALAFEGSPVPMMIVALDGRLSRVNSALCQMLGYGREDLLRLSLLDITHPDDRDMSAAHLRRAASGELPIWQLEQRYLRKDGGAIWGLLSASLVPAAEDTPGYLISQVQDISKRKRAEAQLKYQVNLLENVNDALIATDASFVLTAWNHAAEALYGWKAEEVLGRQASTVQPAEFIAGSRTIRALLESGQWSGELVQARRDGTPLCVEAKAITLRDDSGAISSFVSVNRDITDRKRTEDALRASEERFRLLIENASDIIMIVNADGTFRYLSPAHERRVFGYFHPEDLPAVISAFRAVAQRPGVGPATEFRVRHCDGSWRVIEAIGNNQLDNPGIQGVVVNARDISQRKRAEEALRYRLDFERLLAEISTNFINLSPAETGSSINAALKAIGEFFRIDRSYIMSFDENGTMRLDYEWCAPGTPPVIAEFQNVPIDNYPWWRERRQRLEPVHVPRVDDLPDEGAGKGYLVSQGVQSIVEVPMAGGGLFAVLGLSARSQRAWTEDDVTLIKMAGEMFLNALQGQRAEQVRVELEQRLLELQKLEAVGRLASGVAHDFNNQLTIIKGCAQFLLAGVADEDPLRKDAERINATVDRGAQLVRQLLAFSSEQPTEPQGLDVNHLVLETAPMLRLLLGEQIVLQTKTAPALWQVRADPVQIERVILNLVINAKDAMPESRDGTTAGTVTIETANIGPDMTFHNPAEGPPIPGAYIMIAVSDNGCGMTPEVRERVFEPYFTTKPFGKGTGLGLSTAFGVVKQHGGYISCVSELGVGTTFRVFLPKERTGAVAVPLVEQALERLGADASVSPETPGERGTVLVAEDEEQVREMMRGVLEGAGYRVHVAHGVEEALTVASRLGGRLDLLVTDVAMPGGSGHLLARRLVFDNPAMRVLFISGYPHEWVESVGAVPARFIQKPFSMDTLLQHADEILRE